MIRGIILLILSCVVLNTMATDELLCSCDEDTKPIYEQTHEHFPTPTTKDVKFVKPHDCKDLQEFYEKVSVPDHGILKTCDTGILSGLLNLVQELIATVLKVIHELVELLTGHRKECNLVNSILHWLLHDLLHILKACDHPLCAIQYVDSLMDVHTKQRHMKKMDEYLEKTLAAYEGRHEMLKAQDKITGKYLTVSRDLDTREKNCKTGSRTGSGGLLGGVLGGVVGGVLGGGHCSRLGILDDLLGGLLSGLVNLILQLLEDILCLVDDFLHGLNYLLHDLLEIPAHLLEKVSILDLHEDHVRHDCLYPMMKRFQNKKPLKFDEVYGNYADILGNPTAKSHYMELAGLPFEHDYKFSKHHMICRDHVGNDISVVAKANILDIIKLKAAVGVGISCDIGLNVQVNADVKIGSGLSILDGTTKYLESLVLATKGLIGSQHILSLIDHIDDITGDVKLCLKLDLLKHDLLCGLLSDLDIDLDLDVDLEHVPIVNNVLSLLDLERARGHTHEVISHCDTFQDIPAISDEIVATESKIAKSEEKAIEKKEKKETHIKEAGKAHEEWKEHKAKEEASEVKHSENTEDVIKQTEQCVNTVSSKAKKTHYEKMAALEHYRQAIDDAEMETEICRKQYLEICLRLKSDPTNDHLLQLRLGLKARLGKLLDHCFLLRELCLDLEAEIHLDLELLGLIDLDLCAKLRLNLDGLISGQTKLLADLDLGVAANLEGLTDLLGCFLLNSRDGILGLDIDVDLDLDLDLLTCLFKFDDHCHEGETPEHLHNLHKKYIQSAVVTGCQNPNVHVEQVGYRKRSLESGTASYEYKVTVTNTPTATKSVAFANQETGMSATTAATSSSSSLVFSFFVLFVSVLCFF